MENVEVEEVVEHVDQIEECFVDHEWVKAYGLGAHNVLDYFACSQFYEISCNNEILKMQRRDLSNLKFLKGIEYVLDRSFLKEEPFLFLIVKQHRLSEETVNKLAKYYVLDKVIYESPSLKALFKSRISAYNFHINRALQFIQKSHKFTPSKGHFWEFEDETQTKLWNEKKQEFQQAHQGFTKQDGLPFNEFKAVVDKALEETKTRNS